MSGPAADPSRALVLYLRDQMTDLDGRIYRPELPKTSDSSMPGPTIVIRSAGGYQLFGSTNLPLGDPHLDIYCYGSTWLEADQLARRVVPLLKQIYNQGGGVWGQCRLYWARIAGGPNPVEDPITNWPCSVLTAQIAFKEAQVA